MELFVLVTVTEMKYSLGITVVCSVGNNYSLCVRFQTAMFINIFG